jgi:hypothetical protein
MAEALPRFNAARIDSEERLMSTSAVSSISLHQQLQTYFQARNGDVKQLGQALEAGDLGAAQSAFRAISTLGKSGPFGGGHPFVSQQREQDFQAVGKALQAGDLAGAKAAFATLKSTFQNGRVSSGPVAEAGPAASGTPAAAVGPEIVINLSSGSGSSASPEQVTINIGQSSSGGGEQISLSVGSQGSNPQQVMFNLNPNSNEQIVVNLLDGSSSSSSSGSSTGNNLSVSA